MLNFFQKTGGEPMRYKNFTTLCLSLLAMTANPLQAKSEHKHHQADYVVVGVGTAGATMAKLLSDDKKTSVVALHSGENLTNEPEIKFSENALATVISGIIGPPLYENGTSIPQPNADNRDLLWTLANPLGGASSINVGAWCRGTNTVYSQWEAIAGPEWSVTNITNQYKKLENYHGKTTNKKVRGFRGPLDIRQENPPSKLSEVFTTAMIEATGFPFVLDYNDPNTPIGVSSQFQFTQKGKEGTLRVSSATAFLNRKVMTSKGRGVHGRKLRVLFSSTALRTIWEGNKAVGVEYLSKGKTKKVYAKKGVVVCAGLRSSVFLMQSGIGSEPLLNSLNIPVKFNNPNVGQGMADQPGCILVFSSNPLDISTNPNDNFSQIAWFPSPTGDQTKREIRMATSNPIPGITLCVLDLVQARSRGSVTINSNNPLNPPVIDYGVLNDPQDLVLFQQALQVYVKAINTALNNKNAAYKLIYPSPAILDDINLVTAFVKQAVAGNQSFQCHCRMAPLNQGGVVNGKGQVYGATNLYVADDSALPTPMDGSTMATAFLMAANIARQLESK
jgi:choline dehydrogenase-like flavoprotein